MKRIFSTTIALFIIAISFAQQGQQQDTSKRVQVTISQLQANQIFYFTDHADEMRHRDIESMKAFWSQLFGQAFQSGEIADSLKKQPIQSSKKK